MILSLLVQPDKNDHLSLYLFFILFCSFSGLPSLYPIIHLPLSSFCLGVFIFPSLYLLPSAACSGHLLLLPHLAVLGFVLYQHLKPSLGTIAQSVKLTFLGGWLGIIAGLLQKISRY